MYTPMVNRGNGMSEANRAGRTNASVLKIEGTGWDIGHAVRFLLSAHERPRGCRFYRQGRDHQRWRCCG
jgi:hypothetical protein